MLARPFEQMAIQCIYGCPMPKPFPASIQG